MYLEHFGFKEFPFSLTPDTEYFFANGSHRDVLNVLHIALQAGDGFIAVTAEIGLGKTMLCRLLLRELGDSFTTAYIPDPQLSPRALRIALAEELGLVVDYHWTDEQYLRLIQKRLIELANDGQRVVLLLDEAHQLAPRTLESVRLLTNLETEKSKLLQVVMFGQPELDRRLADESLRQLRQRIGFCCTLSPLDREATSIYIAHRLAIAGCPVVPLFTAGAIDAIHRASGGTPRVINLLCHKSLMVAFGSGEFGVSADHVRRAVADSPHVTCKHDDGAFYRLARWLGRSLAAAGKHPV